jgi:hypothetical protein
MIVAPTVAAAARRSRRECTLLDMGLTSLIAAAVDLSDPHNAAEANMAHCAVGQLRLTSRWAMAPAIVWCT